MALIKLSKDAFFNNAEVIAEKAGKRAIAAVLKDNAYGHGLLEIASLCKEAGIKRAVVRRLGEAEAIAGFFDDILILADLPRAGLSEKFSFTINDISAIAKFPRGSIAQLKIDTGMHRCGIKIAEIERAIALLSDRGAVLRGVFSHLRSADALSSELFWQEKNFEKAAEITLKLVKSAPIFHLHASDGIFRSSGIYGGVCDLARVGISLYGYSGLKFPFKKPPLKPVLSLWADRVCERKLSGRDRAGYGGVYEAERAMKIGIYDVGYGDGFLRLSGGEGARAAGGERILGRVSMDSLAAESGADRICLMNDAEIFASLRGTISYEILTRLSPMIPRVIA